MFRSSLKYQNQLVITLFFQHNIFIIFSSNMDDQFEILVSTQDYLKLQSHCNQLQLQNKAIKQQKEEISSKMLWVNQQNSEQIKKIREMQDNVRYLSLQGVKLAQQVLQLTKNKSEMTVKTAITAEAQVQTTEQNNKMQGKHEEDELVELEKKQEMKAQVTTQHTQTQTIQHKISQQSQTIPYLCQQCQQLTKQLQILQQSHKNLRKQSDDKMISLQNLIQSLKSEKNTLLAAISQLQSKHIQKSKQQEENIQKLKSNQQKLTKQLNQIKPKLNIMRDQNIKMGHQLEKKVCEIEMMKSKLAGAEDAKREYAKSKKEYEGMGKQLQEWKVRKLDQAEIHLKEYMDLIQGQNIHIKQLQKCQKQKDSLLQFYQQIQKQSSERVAELQRKLSERRQKEEKVKMKMKSVDSSAYLQQVIQQYFTNLAVKLLQGQITQPQIQNTFQIQKQYFVEFIHNIVKQILKEFGIRTTRSTGKKDIIHSISS